MSLINHTLDYSKIESGLIELEKIDFKLSDIASKLSAIFSSLASERGIFFQLVVEESVPNALIGDPLRLEQILINLCNNAIKFTNTGGVTLKVTSETIDEQYVELTFKVIDSGIGIKADQQDKLFEAFSQAEVGTKRLYGGTGLGLSICKKLVDVMKGSIALKSQVDIGTEITVLLCFKVNPETHQAGMETSSNEHSDEELLADLNVLLVEDVAINQELATYILEDFGAHVFTVNNGQEAIDFLNNGQVIDVILMDLQMPVMGGIEATQKIVANPATRPIPIIAMTANAISTDVNACFDAGMRDHIAKPIDENDLLQKIIKHCKRKAS